jgi:MerR family transcriptional regulator, copper efflux regulator
VTSEGRYQIGEVAESVGLSISTIRHYDELGVVVPSARSSGGFRLYTDADVERLRFVKRLRPLQFGLEEITDLMRLLDETVDPVTASVEALDRLSMYAAAVEQRCVLLREQLAAAREVGKQLRSAIETRSVARLR